MMRLSKAHAYGNDFLYVRRDDLAGADRLDALARELCDRHTGIGADGLMIYHGSADRASMELFNADGSRSEVSGNGVRGLAALLLRDDAPVLLKFSIGGFRRLLARFRDVRIVPERFPVKSRLQGGWKGAVYNGLFVGTFNALPRAWVRRFGWHLLALCTK